MRPAEVGARFDPATTGARRLNGRKDYADVLGQLPSLDQCHQLDGLRRVAFRIVHRSGRAALEEHTRESLLGYVGRRVNFQRSAKDGAWVATDPARKLADDILSMPEFAPGSSTKKKVVGLEARLMVGQSTARPITLRAS